MPSNDLTWYRIEGRSGLESCLVAVNPILNRTGQWKVTVTNPKSVESSPFQFIVWGPPDIDSVKPAQPAHGAAPLRLTFYGDGFLPGITVHFRAHAFL